jgi:hypothetical protein
MKRSSNFFDTNNEGSLPNKKFKIDDNSLHYSYLLNEISILKTEIFNLKNSINEILKNNIDTYRTFDDKPCSYIS